MACSGISKWVESPASPTHLPSNKSAIPGNEVSSMIALPYPSLLGTTLGIGKEAARKSKEPQTRALFEKAKDISHKHRLKTF